MTNQNAKETVKAILARALWTFLEVVLSGITIGTAIYDLDWKGILGISATSAVYALIKSIIVCLSTKGLPETKIEGAFLIDDNDPDKTLWTLKYDGDPTDLKPGDSVRFLVKSQEGGDNNEPLA